MPSKVKASFVEPMLLQHTEKLPDNRDRLMYELKLDGYRAIAYKTGGTLRLRSRNNKDFDARYPAVVRGLARLPDETVIDGEIVALDDSGRPSFSALQNYGSPATPIVYYVFDVMVLAGHNVMAETLESRRSLLERNIVPKLAEPVRYSTELDATLKDLVHSVRTLGLEGVVAKRRNGRYEPGLRSGSWMKMRVNRGEEFVIAGYTVGTKTFDAIVIGHYAGGQLLYVARTRNGFTPLVRDQLFKKFRRLEIPECPFANLPEARGGRWGQGLTKEKMADCRWLKPDLVGFFEFVEWTPDNHLRHAKFVSLRDDKPAHAVIRE
jgi:DNA ligase D-like protein (predicted ligase)